MKLDWVPVYDKNNPRLIRFYTGLHPIGRNVMEVVVNCFGEENREWCVSIDHKGHFFPTAMDAMRAAEATYTGS